MTGAAKRTVVPCAAQHKMLHCRHGILRGAALVTIPDNAFGVSGMTKEAHTDSRRTAHGMTPQTQRHFMPQRALGGVITRAEQA